MKAIKFGKENTYWLFPIGGILLTVAALLLKNLPYSVTLILYTLALLAAGTPVGYPAIRQLVEKKDISDTFLITVASIGAFLIGHFPESIVVLLLYQAISAVTDLIVTPSNGAFPSDNLPTFAMVMRHGTLTRLSPAEVAVGEVVVVSPGEQIPMDAVVLEGHSFVDTFSPADSSKQKEIAAGDIVPGGSINRQGTLTCRVVRTFNDSFMNRIPQLADQAITYPSRFEIFLTALARWYAAIIVVLALLLAILPPLCFRDARPGIWLYRAFLLLSLSSFRPLVQTVTDGFCRSIHQMLRNGVLIKGNNVLEKLSCASVAVIDFTDTMANSLQICDICPYGMSQKQFLHLAAYAVQSSAHPLARLILSAYGKKPLPPEKAAREVENQGVVAFLQGHCVAVGNRKLMETGSIECPDVHSDNGFALYVATDGSCVGYFIIADGLAAEVDEHLALLKNSGIRQTVMLTDDEESKTNIPGIDTFYTATDDEDKTNILRQLREELPAGKTILFIGGAQHSDSLLSTADIGMAIGELTADSVNGTANAFVLGDTPFALANALDTAETTISRARQSSILVLAVRFFLLLAGVTGLIGLWAALVIRMVADMGAALIMQHIHGGKIHYFEGRDE